MCIFFHLIEPRSHICHRMYNALLTQGDAPGRRVETAEHRNWLSTVTEKAVLALGRHERGLELLPDEQLVGVALLRSALESR